MGRNRAAAGVCCAAHPGGCAGFAGGAGRWGLGRRLGGCGEWWNGGAGSVGGRRFGEAWVDAGGAWAGVGFWVGWLDLKYFFGSFVYLYSIIYFLTAKR